MSWKFPIFIFCYLVSFAFARRGGSGTNIHHYPNYPHSYPHQPQTRSSPTHGNPQATQSHNYPNAPGLSGNSHSQGYRHYQRTEVHNHYHYSPPQHISYGSTQHPVFKGEPPAYVYQYRDSGSRFDTLLAGLALYNLGRMSSNHDHYSRGSNYDREYHGNPGEICKLVIDKSNGEYEGTRIDCKLMSSFIWDAESKPAVPTTNVVTKTVSVQNITKDGNTTVINIQNTTVVDALHVKGPSIVVKPEMTCFMTRISRDSSELTRKVDCSLLQAYATKSLRYYNGSSHMLSMITINISVLITFILW